MSNIITMLNTINDAIFVSLVNTTLQITLLIPVIALIIWMFRIKSATTRYSLWLFALFAMLALPLLTPFVSQMGFLRFHHQRAADGGPDDTMRLGMGASDVGELSEADGSMLSTSAAKAGANKEADVSLVNPVSIAYFIWCAGALSMFCVTIGIYRKLRKLKIDSSDVESQAALEILSRLKNKLGIRRTVALKTSSEVYIPMSMGILSPVIIVPDSVIDNSASDQLEMILAHELAHIKRCDYLIRLLQNMLKAFFFFHPLYHLMNRNLTREREHICDDWVIGMTRRRRGYAECIIGLLEKALYRPVNVPVTIAMAERKRDIPRRIDMIMDKKRKITAKVSKKALIAMFLIGFLALPIIGGIKLVSVAGARPASNEGWIVFNRHRLGIWVMDADGKNEKQLTTGMDGEPAWSPDGRQIAFRRFIGAGKPSGGIYVMNADGSNKKLLTNNGPEEDRYPTWSPDGKQIAFSRSVWEKKGDLWNRKSGGIYVMDADGSNLRKLVEGPWEAGSLDWSPNGKRIAFRSTRDSKWGDIYVMDADGADIERVTFNNNFTDGTSWSPDGAKIAFGRGLTESNWEIYVMDADGKNQVNLTNTPGICESTPCWSPDGTKIALRIWEGPDDSPDIYIMDADGSNVQQLTNTPELKWGLDWTASSYAVEPAGKLRTTWGKIKRKLFGK